MRKISTQEIVSNVKELCMTAASELGSDMMTALRKAKAAEESPLGMEVIKQIIDNAFIARKENVPMCQDTGVLVIFVEIGSTVIVDGNLVDALNEGVRQGYKDGFLRKSICHPLTRANTGDNTPAVIHSRIVDGDKLKISIALKGAGSENMSRLKMLKPYAGVEGIEQFILETVSEAGGNPCPPIIVGVGIGGDFERSAILAKETLFREIGSPNPDDELADLESRFLKKINELGIGPMGFGGRITALAVHIKTLPCHIASLPVAVNIQCHAARHKEAVI